MQKFHSLKTSGNTTNYNWDPLLEPKSSPRTRGGGCMGVGSSWGSWGLWSHTGAHRAFTHRWLVWSPMCLCGTREAFPVLCWGSTRYQQAKEPFPILWIPVGVNGCKHVGVTVRQWAKLVALTLILVFQLLSAPSWELSKECIKY